MGGGGEAGRGPGDGAPRGAPSPGAGHGDLPESWSPSLRHELALALACSVQSAETTALLAWEQQARLPGTAAALADGTLTFAKARAVTETFRCLTDADAARAEAMIAGQLAGKAYMQVLRLAEQAALTVDPDLAGRRRIETQKDARVSLFREETGAAGLSGRDLPPDETLAAMASVNARAQEYRDSGAFGDARMDLLRAHGYLDLLNGVPAAARIAAAEPHDEAAEAAELLKWAKARAARNAAQRNGPGSDHPERPSDTPHGSAGRVRAVRVRAVRVRTVLLAPALMAAALTAAAPVAAVLVAVARARVTVQPARRPAEPSGRARRT